MKRRPASPGTLKFLIAAMVFMVLIDRFFFGGTRPYIEEVRRETPVALVETQAPVSVRSEEPEAVPVVPVIAGEEEQEPELPAWRKFAVPVDVPPGMPTVTVIIDDLGEYPANTREAVQLPGPLTMAFLPYPRNVAAMVVEARAGGHEIMVHMPMEATNAALDKGDYVLRAAMIPDRFEDTMEKNLSAFDGYVGINNHMGSALTQDAQAMRIVMAHLQRRGLLFVDSRTIGSSVAADMAAEQNIPFAVRDVFLDNEPDEASVLRNLEKLEETAQRTGKAIGICHPKRGTIAALKKWLPTLAEKGIVLVPASAVVRSGAE